MNTNTNAAPADIPGLGAKALASYLEDCDKHAIKPDVGGAFAHAFSAGAALSTAVAQVPAGMVMVPAEATDEMVQAAYRIDLSYMPGQEGADRAAIYRAMIAAAPKAAKAEAEPVQQPDLLTRIKEPERERDHALMAAEAEAREVDRLRAQQPERVPLSATQCHEVLEKAGHEYQRYTSTARGQMFSIYDSPEYWVIRATEMKHGIQPAHKEQPDE